MWKPLTTLLFAFALQSYAFAADDDISVKVQKDGEAIVIDLAVTVPVTPQEAWDVLVDFDHMPQFMSNLQASKILEKNGNTWKVEQKGQSSHGGFSFAFESVREVELKPYESIHSHLVSGTMKKHEGLTQLSPSGSGTKIVYHAESIANVWVPPLVGTSLVEGDVRKQFQEMEAEMLKRKAAKAGN